MSLYGQTNQNLYSRGAGSNAYSLDNGIGTIYSGSSMPGYVAEPGSNEIMMPLIRRCSGCEI
jgi:hypothetical protein